MTNINPLSLVSIDIDVEAAKGVASRLDLGVELEYIREDHGDGVMRLPTLVINDAVVSMGRVLKSAEVENL